MGRGVGSGRGAADRSFGIIAEWFQCQSLTAAEDSQRVTVNAYSVLIYLRR